MKCDIRALGETRGSVVSMVVFSSMESKVIFYCDCWRAWSAILRVIACLLGFGYVLYLWALKLFCCCSSQHRSTFGYLYLIFCLIVNYPFDEGVDTINNLQEKKDVTIVCILDF